MAAFLTARPVLWPARATSGFVGRAAALTWPLATNRSSSSSSSSSSSCSTNPCSGSGKVAHCSPGSSTVTASSAVAAPPPPGAAGSAPQTAASEPAYVAPFVLILKEAVLSGDLSGVAQLAAQWELSFGERWSLAEAFEAVLERRRLAWASERERLLRFAREAPSNAALLPKHRKRFVKDFYGLQLDGLLEACRRWQRLITEHLLPTATTAEARVSYHCMLGDVQRHVALIYWELARSRSTEQKRLETLACLAKDAAEQAYTLGMVNARGLQPDHPTRLRLALSQARLFAAPQPQWLNRDAKCGHGVDMTLRDVSELLSGLRDGDTIDLAGKVYGADAGTQLDIRASNVTISNGTLLLATSQVLTITGRGVVLKDLKVCGSQVEGSCNTSKGTVQDLKVRGSEMKGSSDTSKGMVQVFSGAEVALTRCHLSHALPYTALWLKDGAKVTMVDSQATASANEATGCVVEGSGTALVATNSRFQVCSGSGLIGKAGCTITLTDSNCTGSQKGHGLYTSGAGTKVVATGCGFGANFQCGATIAGGSVAEFMGCKLKGNRAQGLQAQDAGSYVELLDCDASGNIETNVLVSKGGEVVMTNTKVHGSQDLYGARCDDGGSKLTAIKCSLTSNGKAGAIICGGSIASFADCDISDNKSVGLIALKKSNVMAIDCQLNNNNIGIQVDGEGSKAVLTNCTANNNLQTGVLVLGGGAVEMERCECKGSKKHAGLEVKSKGSTCTAVGCSFLDSQEQSGVVACEGASATLVECTAKGNEEESVKAKEGSKVYLTGGTFDKAPVAVDTAQIIC